MKILVINCGSSSLKYQLMDMENESVLAKGKCDMIGLSASFIEYKVPSKDLKVKEELPLKDHNDAMSAVIKYLTDKEIGAVADIAEITATGHRLVHGGEKFSSSVIVTEEVIKEVENCADLAPLHNPSCIIGVRACQAILPNVPIVGVFDTAFHQTMPKEAYLYGLPYEYYEKYRVRRYGFHGTSHRYVTARAADMLGKAEEDINIISCHLGNGASICAVKNGKSVDTSMGLTPLEGLVMGTRSGNFDPAIAKYIMEHEGMDIKEWDKVINKKSGLLGISGLSSDVRELRELRDAGKEMADLALKVQAYSVRKYIGSYMAVLGHVDAITIEGGIGEHNPDVCNLFLSGLEELGVKIDQAQMDYEFDCREKVLSTEDSKIKVLLIPTDEELMIARDTLRLVTENK